VGGGLIVKYNHPLIVDICREVQNIFKGKKFEKGIAFPTCVAANRWVMLGLYRGLFVLWLGLDWIGVLRGVGQKMWAALLLGRRLNCQKPLA